MTEQPAPEPGKAEPRAEDDRRIAIDFIDPLFAVVLHLSAVQAEHRPWFDDLGHVFSDGGVAFEFFCWILALTFVVLSWVGYHQSIRDTSIDVKHPAGFFRFVLDVVLLGLYWIILVKFQDFYVQLWTLLAIFVIFAIWDQLKRFETPRDDSEQKKAERGRRRAVTLYWLAISLALSAAYTLVRQDGAVEWEDVMFLVLAFAAAILYRIHKIRPIGTEWIAKWV